MNKIELKLPKGYEKIEKDLPGNAQIPENAELFGCGEMVSVICFPVDEETAMPFGEEDLSARLKEEIGGSKLLFSQSGTTGGGLPFVCDLLKRPVCGGEGFDYLLNMNLKQGEEIAYVGAKFAEAPGSLDAVAGAKALYEFLIENN